MKTTIISIAITLFGMLFTELAHASRCDAHYPFDGSLVDATGNGYDGLMITEGGGAAEPEFGDGRFGQALHISGNRAMRSFLDLHHERCPQFTITAWFRLPSVADERAQPIVSTGAAGAAPALVVRDGSLLLYGNANGLSQRDAVRDGSAWYFAALTFDYAAREYKLHWRNRTVDGTLSATPYDAEDAFWIGAKSDAFRFVAQDLHVDEVRVYGRVLSADEIRDVASNAPVQAAAASSPSAPATADNAQAPGEGAACSAATACAGGLYCARDLTCHPESHLPLGAQGGGPVTAGGTGGGPTGIGTAPTGPARPPIGGGGPGSNPLGGAANQPDPLQAQTPETLDCRIDTATTLRNRPAAVDYEADCVVDVTAPLTIEPGVVIRFAADAGLGVFDNGAISAVGTATQPIVLQGTSGAWRGVFVGTRSSANALEHVRIDGAGSNYVYCCREAASLLLEGAQISLSNVQLSNGSGLGLKADASTRFPQYNGVRISSHAGYPVSADWAVLAALAGPGSDYSGNAADFVPLPATRLETAATLPNLNVPYLLPGDVVDVTGALTIEAGTELVVMENGGLGVFDGGTLTADGTAAEPIVWRGAQASRGYWRGIFASSDSASNRLRNVEIHHAGSDYVYCCDDVAALVLRSGRMTLENATITESGGCAVHVGSTGTLAASGNTFTANAGGDSCYGEDAPEPVAQGDCTTGEVRVFSGAFVPRGWASADGTMLDTQQYSDLYSVVGTTYGGDGRSTFALPDVAAPAAATAGATIIICVNGVYPTRS